MARPQPPQPDPDSEAFWPSCDDQQSGVSIRPFAMATSRP